MKNITLWVRRYVTVYGIIMLCTFFMCLLFNPASELPVVTFFGRIMVFTLIALLSLAVYYSKEELTVKAWWVRTVMHLLLLEAVLLPLAHHWGFWQSGTIFWFMPVLFCWPKHYGTWQITASTQRPQRRSMKGSGKTGWKRGPERMKSMEKCINRQETKEDCRETETGPAC